MATRDRAGGGPSAHEPRAVACARGRRPDRRRARRRSRGRLGRAGAEPAARLRPDRPAGAASVVRSRQPLLRRLGDAAAARARAGRGDRLGRRSHASRPPAPHRDGQELRRGHRPGHARARNDRRGDHRGGARQPDRHRGPRPGGRAPRREGRVAGRDDRRRRGGACDPLGGRQRRARRQHLTGRPARPAPPEPRHVLASRGGSGPVCREARRGRRRGGRERRPGAPLPLALRELPGGARACGRRECTDAKRRLTGVRTGTRSSTTSRLRARTSSRRSRARSRRTSPAVRSRDTPRARPTSFVRRTARRSLRRR